MQRHSTDPVSLVAGVTFAVLGALMLADRLDVLTQARWLAPLLLIVIAIVMLVSVSPRRHGQTDTSTERSDG